MAKKLDLLINAASMQYCMIKLFQNFISSGDEEKYRSIFRKIDMFYYLIGIILCSSKAYQQRYVDAK